MATKLKKELFLRLPLFNQCCGSVSFRRIQKRIRVAKSYFLKKSLFCLMNINNKLMNNQQKIILLSNTFFERKKNITQIVFLLILVRVRIWIQSRIHYFTKRIKIKRIGGTDKYHTCSRLLIITIDYRVIYDYNTA